MGKGGFCACFVTIDYNSSDSSTDFEEDSRMALNGWNVRMKRYECGYEYSDALINPKERNPYLTSQDPPFSGQVLFNKYYFCVAVCW